MMGKLDRQRAYDKGVWSEEIAAEFLEGVGLEILSRRFKTKFGEIDLVAAVDDTLVFVEVKARASYVDGVEAVNYKARRRIEQAALYFVSQHDEYADFGMRFDVIVVSGGGAEGVDISVEHLDNAWMAGD